MVIPSMPKKLRLLLVLLCGFAIVTPLPARAAEEGWLDWFNRNMFEFNAATAATLRQHSDALPALPEGLRDGVLNLARTYIGEPLNASAHLLAGRTDDALVAVQRMGINVTRGWLGAVDRAAEEGLVTNPIDFGLALCVRGVPPGPFLVMPLTGIRTVRDFLADWTAAHVVLYGAIFGVLQVPVSLENLVVLEAVEEVATLAIAGELGEVPAEARVPDLAQAQQQYLAGRERRCAELSQ